MPVENIFLLDNGDCLEVSAKGVRQGDSVQSGIVYVDGLSVGDTSEDVLNDRNELSAQGIASIAAAIEAKRNASLGVHVEMRGITGGDDDELLTDVETAVKRDLDRALADHKKRNELEKACRQALQNVLWDRIKQRPMVIVNLLNV